MLRFLRQTWLPTAVFVGLSWLYASADRNEGVIRYATVIVPPIIVPLLWKSFVIREGRPHVHRAALAGAASAFLFLWSGSMTYSVRQFIHFRGPRRSELL